MWTVVGLRNVVESCTRLSKHRRQISSFKQSRCPFQSRTRNKQNPAYSLAPGSSEPVMTRTGRTPRRATPLLINLRLAPSISTSYFSGSCLPRDVVPSIQRICFRFTHPTWCARTRKYDSVELATCTRNVSSTSPSDRSSHPLRVESISKSAQPKTGSCPIQGTRIRIERDQIDVASLSPQQDR